MCILHSSSPLVWEKKTSYGSKITPNLKIDQCLKKKRTPSKRSFWKWQNRVFKTLSLNRSECRASLRLCCEAVQRSAREEKFMHQQRAVLWQQSPPPSWLNDLVCKEGAETVAYLVLFSSLLTVFWLQRLFHQVRFVNDTLKTFPERGCERKIKPSEILSGE